MVPPKLSSLPMYVWLLVLIVYQLKGTCMRNEGTLISSLKPKSVDGKQILQMFGHSRTGGRDFRCLQGSMNCWHQGSDSGVCLLIHL